MLGQQEALARGLEVEEGRQETKVKNISKRTVKRELETEIGIGIGIEENKISNYGS